MHYHRKPWKLKVLTRFLRHAFGDYQMGQLMRHSVLALGALMTAGSSVLWAQANEGGDWYQVETGCESAQSGEVYAGDCVIEDDYDLANQEVVIQQTTEEAGVGGILWGSGSKIHSNTVTVKGGEGTVGSVYGAIAIGAGNETNNNLVRVVDTKMEIFGGVVGAVGLGAENVARGNTVEIENYNSFSGSAEDENSSLIAGAVIEAEEPSATPDALAEQNIVRLNEVNAWDNRRVYGALIGGSGTVRGNEVHVQDSFVAQELIGGAVFGTGEVVDNKVYFTDTQASLVMGGEVRGDGIARNNEVHIHDSGMQKLNIGELGVFGGRVTGEGQASANQVVVTGSGTDEQEAAIWGYIVGGAVDFSGVANDNEVLIQDTYIPSGREVIGGSVGYFDPEFGAQIAALTPNSPAQMAPMLEASGNTVRLIDSHVDIVVGGQSRGSGVANDNTIIVEGNSIVDSALYAGEVWHEGPERDAKNNRIVIMDSPMLGSAHLHGGVTLSGESEGNTLELRSKGIEAANIHDFQIYEFVLPEDTVAGDVMLSLLDESGTDLGEGEVIVATEKRSHRLQAGDRISLVHNESGVQSEGVISSTERTPDGAFLLHNYELARDEQNLYADILSTELSEATKAPLEGRLSGLALLDQSGIRTGDALVQATLTAEEGGTGLYGIMTGGHSRYKTGSHINVNGVGMMIGLSKGFAGASSTTTVGAFVEAGWGSHRTHNRFDAPIGKVKGRGNSRFFGVGVLGKHDWAQDGAGGPYVEGSLRGGRLRTDWRTHDLPNTDGRVKYKTSSGYFGVHAGAGYVIPLGASTDLDLAAKYFWTRVGSDTVRIDGDKFNFKSITSSIGHLGATLKQQIGDDSKAYVGLAWEREFKGRARATVHGLSAPAPGLKGNTGILDAGLELNADAKNAFSARFGVRGYAGTRRGVDGYLNASYRF